MLKIKKIYHILLAIYPISSGYGFPAQLDFGTILVLVMGYFYPIMQLLKGTFRTVSNGTQAIFQPKAFIRYGYGCII